MKERLQAWGERIDALSLRERTLLFVMAAAVLVALVNTALLDPLLNKQKRLSNHILQTEGQISATHVQIQNLMIASHSDPNEALRKRHASVSQRLQELNALLLNTERGLINPERMAGLLQDLLNRNQGLELVSLKSLPVKNLSAVAKESKPGASERFIYQHGVQLTVEGEYASLMNYLAALEQLPWQMYWSEASLKVEQYPKSKLTLTLYTLSLDKSWLAV